MINTSHQPNFDITKLTLPNTEQIIKKLYQEDLSNNEKKLKEHSWLEKGHPLGDKIAIDWKLAAQLLGDGHIAGTPLEGNSSNVSLSFFTQFLKQLLEQSKTDKKSYGFLAAHTASLKNFITSLDEAKSLSNMIDQLILEGVSKDAQEREKLLDACAEKLLLHFREKKTGWIPCGWDTKNGESHVMMAHLDMKQGQVTLVNSGAGLTENHPLVQVASKDPLTGKIKEEMKAQEFVTYTDVDKTRMRDKTLFRFLLELQCRPHWDGLLEFGPENIYQPLKKYLKGKEQSALCPFSHPEAYKKPQHSGTCTTKSVSTTLYYTLAGSFQGKENGKKGANCYKKIKYLWQTLALVSLAKQVDKSLTESQRLLLEDLMENVCRSAEKLYKKKLLGDKDLLELNCTIKDLKKQLSVTETTHKMENPAPLDPLLAKGSCNLPQVAIHTDSKDLSKIISGPSSASKAVQEETPVESFIKKLNNEFPKLIQEGKTEERLDQVLKLFEDLEHEKFQTSYGKLNRKDKKAIREVLLNYLGSYITNLPIPSKEKPSYWNTLPQADVVGTMQKVSDLMILLVKVKSLYSSQSKPNYMPPEITVMHYALLAMIDQLARSLPESKLKGFDVNYYDLILKMRSPQFVLKDPHVQKTLGDIVRYFDPTITLDKLVDIDAKHELFSKCNQLFAFKSKAGGGAFFSGQLSVSEEDSKSDPHVTYFSQFLKEIQNDPAKVEKLYQRGKIHAGAIKKTVPLTPAHSKLEHLIALLTDTDPDDEDSLIPKSVRLLLQAAIHCSVANYCNYFDYKSFSKSKYTFNLNAFRVSDTALNFDIKVVPWAYHNQLHYTLLHKYKDVQDDNLLKRYPTSLLIKDIENRPKQNKLILRQAIHFGLGLDISREIEMMGVDPYEEVARVAAFIKKHLNLLKEKEIQDLLEIHLFRFGRLDSLMKDAPGLVSELAESIHKAIQHYIQMDDLTTSLYLAKLGQDLKVYVEKAGTQTGMKDFRFVIYEEILPIYKEDVSAKLRCFETIESFYENLSPEQVNHSVEQKKQLVVDIAGFCLYRALHGGDKKLSKNRAVEIKMLPVIEEALKDPNIRETTLNGVIKRIVPTAKDGVWSGTFPQFESEKYVINLNEWTVVDKAGGQFSYMPQNILNDDTFRKVYKDKIATCEKKNDGLTYVINGGQPNELIVRKSGDSLEFQRKIDGVDYRYHNTPDLLNEKMPTIIDGTTHCWISQGQDPQMIVFNGKLRVLEAKMKKSIYSDVFAIQSISKCDSNGKVIPDLTWLPFHKAPPSFKFLKNLEDKEIHIECWASAKDKNDLLEEIKLPRLGLSFKQKEQEGKRFLFSEQYPGYFLEEDQEIPALSKTPCYITLQNLSGERKILLPGVPLETRFTAGRLFNKAILQHMAPPFSWMEYAIKEGDLSPLNMQSQLYLLSLTLAKGNYNAAGKQLKALNPLDRFRDNKEENIMERTLIKGILTSLPKDKHRHPAAQALCLKIAFLLYTNDLKYPLPINAEEEEPLFTLQEIAMAYGAYSQNASNAAAHKLSEKEEKFIVNKIFELLDKEIKKTKNKKTLAILERNKKMIELQWGERRKYLNTGKVKLGHRILRIPQPLKKAKEVHVNTLLQLFGKPQLGKEEFFQQGIIQDEKYFEEKFFTLYNIAQGGNKKEREYLKKFFNLNCARNSSYYDILKDVLTKPAHYPSFKKLETLHVAVAKKLKAYSETPFVEEKELAMAAYQKAVNKEIKAFAKIAPKKTTFVMVQEYVRGLFKLFFSSTIGKFSLGTKAYETIIHRFRATFQKKQAQKTFKRKTPLITNPKTLHETDWTFDVYFKTLLGKYFTVKEVPVSEFKEKLPETHADKNIAAKLKKENEELEAFQKSLPKTEKIYDLSPGASLANLREELEKMALHLETELKTQKVALLWQLNDIPQHNVKRSLKETHNTGFHKQMSWEDLRDITLQGDLQTFRDRTHLKAKDAKRLMMGVSDFLIKSSRVDQMRAVIATVKKYEKTTGDKNSKTHLQSIPQAMLAFRAYKPNTSNLSKQWFEAANHYHYRAIQLEKIEAFSNPSHDEIQGEAPTGFGKTKTAIPSLNYKKGLAGKLVVNTWPASLEMQNALDSKEQMLSFGKKVDRLHFTRASSITTESLAHVYKEMLLDQEKGIPVNTRSETIRSLELHTLLLLKQAGLKHGKQSELHKQIGYLIEILCLIRTEGWNSIDEEHANLDPLDKLIYTLGDPFILSLNEIDLFEEVFDLIEEGHYLKALKESLVPEIKFMNDIAPKIALSFGKKFHISPANHKSYLDFVLGKSGKNIPLWIKKHPQRGKIALLKGLLTEVLKTSVKGSVDEHFGLSKLHVKKKEYAIPYASANTPKETEQSPSQCKNPHETMSKTYLTYLHTGLSRDQMGKLMEFLKSQALEETKEGGSLENTQANHFFKTIAPFSTKSLYVLKEQDIDQLHSLCKHNRKVLFYYIRNIVVPQLKIYPKSLVSTVHNFRSQFPCSLSLSATPQDKTTHGPDTYFVPMKGTSGQVTHLLLTKCKNPKTLHEIQSTEPKEALEESLEISAKNPRIHATIDIGANFKGLNNLEVAEKMRQKFKNTEIQAVLFFDEKAGLFRMMDIASGQTHDTNGSKLDPEYTQTFYDQSRCFGSDIKQAVDAVGIMLAGKNTTKREVGQAGGRMRLWHQGQSVEVGYPKAVTKEIFGVEGPDIKQLLVYWIANDVKSQENKNYQSQLQQMDNEIRRSLMDKILGLKVSKKPPKTSKKPDIEKAIALVAKWEGEFFSNESNDPWKMYAGIPEEKDTIASLKKHQSRCLKKTAKLEGLDEVERKYISKRLKSYSKKWPQMTLPAKVKDQAAGLGMECEVLQEVEVEAEVEIQAHTKEQFTERQPSKWSKKLDLFTPGWEKPEKQSIALKKFARALTSWFPKNPVGKVFTGLSIGSAISAVAATAMIIAGLAWPIIAAVGGGIALLGLGYGVFALVTNHHITKGNPIYRVKDLMTLHLPAKVNKASAVFSTNFLVSNNYYVQQTQAVAETPQKPFNVEQKPVFTLVVIMDEKKNGKKEVQVMAIDQNDSPFFHKKLKEDNALTDEPTASKRTRKVGLYDIGNEMFTAQGKNPFTKEDLKHPDLSRLISEAKFLNGEINYNEEEMKHFGPHLQQVGKKVGYGPLQRLYENHILQFHTLNRTLLQNKKNPKLIAQVLGLNKAAAAA